MSEEDKKILSNFINKKEEILEFEEIKTIVKLLIEVDKKINELLPIKLEIKNKGEIKNDIRRKKSMWQIN